VRLANTLPSNITSVSAAMMMAFRFFRAAAWLCLETAQCISSGFEQLLSLIVVGGSTSTQPDLLRSSLLRGDAEANTILFIVLPDKLHIPRVSGIIGVATRIVKGDARKAHRHGVVQSAVMPGGKEQCQWTNCMRIPRRLLPQVQPGALDGKEVTFKDKLFLKEHIRTFLHIPLGFGKVMVKTTRRSSCGCLPPQPLMLYDDTSLWEPTCISP